MQHRSTQQGITLITCMIVLVIITLLGLASIEDSTLEEKMAGNLRNRNLAFQLAESALRQGETYILTVSSLPDFDGTGGHYQAMGDVLHDFPAASWSSASARQYTGADVASLQTAEMPLYIIEQLKAEAPGADTEAGTAIDDERFYRITARAVGGNSSAEVILQSIVKR
ncbi:pilus assembly PilX family protein [Motiliproteus sediminis]|uniref:pilus assembly PilX family protein n=1 Tax=Motiliproteus sediminis TaxID=1468178 RepID=UPI001AEF45D9|nr:PilX N-terminal domain-containing pilus assembly protein [Motiliproteus sediminis]